ncbi:unnamed protein product [Fraxinus pennsylvanica]|uniref:Disease resistance protein winged helix domain-containing protein n=1 Tax=Fraxinus pennsylvanica TaxID=56036 RepID=A0AAD2AID3_9LAMI|nr:unnamed protein product [Fraxinus pennsylvanica]
MILSPADEEAKKKARGAKFGSVAKTDSVEEDKKKATEIRSSLEESASHCGDIFTTSFHEIAKLIEEVDSLKTRAEKIEDESSIQEDLERNTSLPVGSLRPVSSGQSTMVGLDDSLAEIRDRLVSSSSHLEAVSIVGMGGIGCRGNIKPACSKTLEELGEDYFLDLVQRSLILVQKKGSNGKIKTCRIHDLLRDLCVKEARKENFFHAIEGGQGGTSMRHVSIQDKKNSLSSSDEVQFYQMQFYLLCGGATKGTLQGDYKTLSSLVVWSRSPPIEISFDSRPLKDRKSEAELPLGGVPSELALARPEPACLEAIGFGSSYELLYLYNKDINLSSSRSSPADDEDVDGEFRILSLDRERTFLHRQSPTQLSTISAPSTTVSGRENVRPLAPKHLGSATLSSAADCRQLPLKENPTQALTLHPKSTALNFFVLADFFSSSRGKVGPVSHLYLSRIGSSFPQN